MLKAGIILGVAVGLGGRCTNDCDCRCEGDEKRKQARSARMVQVRAEKTLPDEGHSYG